jgi:hypothetical protein
MVISSTSTSTSTSTTTTSIGKATVDVRHRHQKRVLDADGATLPGLLTTRRSGTDHASTPSTRRLVVSPQRLVAVVV